MKWTTAAYVASVLVLFAAIVAWTTTGREGYTRWPDAKLAQSDAPQSQIEEVMLADIGFEDDEEPAAQPDIKSRFAFGLLPGGFDLRHLPSLGSAAILAILISSFAAAAGWLRGRTNAKPHSTVS